MKYRYYVTDLFEGSVFGTDNTEKVVELSYCEEYFIVDTSDGSWVTHGKSVEIGELE